MAEHTTLQVEGAPMQRGRTEAETVALNGWAVGTLVRGHEAWPTGEGVWTTWRITGIGEEMVLARTVRSDYTVDGVVRFDDRGRVGTDGGREHSVTFTCREWFEVSDSSIDPPASPPSSGGGPDD